MVIAPGVVNLPQNDTDGGLQWTWVRLSHFDTVLIDNINAYDTTLWGGIFVWGMQLEGDTAWKNHAQDRTRRSKNFTIRNSTVHDTYGDGFAVYLSDNVLMENNVVYRSGMEPPNPANPTGGTIGTPVALWYWSADSVTAQFNEAYDNHSPGADGGAFDLDYFSSNGNYQYNYAHDNSAYCVGIFGAEGTTHGQLDLPLQHLCGSMARRPHWWMAVPKKDAEKSTYAPGIGEASMDFKFTTIHCM